MTTAKSSESNGFVTSAFQWGDTENALTFWAQKLFNKKIKYKDIEEFFLEKEFNVSEKYDGTNVGKDKNGQLYSRRLLIESDKEEFIGTSLKSVKSTDVTCFHDYLVNKLHSCGNGIKNTIVFGELMCNPDLHGYDNRGLSERWLLFGAIIDVEEEYKKIS